MVRTGVLAEPDASDAAVEAVLSKYLLPAGGRPTGLAGPGGVYRRLVHSAQDYGMGAGVIGGSMGGVDALEDVLLGFDPTRVAVRYPDVDRWPDLLDEIVERVRPRGKVRRGPSSVWPRFCRSALSGAAFLSRFGTAAAFFEWADGLDRHDALRATLPDAISREVYGLGFALACAFLMGLGYTGFAKPDVHVLAIVGELGLSAASTDRAAFEAVTRVAASAGQTPFHVDRVLWLIASGSFYLDGAHVGRRRDDFVAHAAHLLAVP